jgi:hypothetical protein
MDATVRPIIDPPKKAIVRALAAPLSRAATAVLTFALVAAYIPTKPAKPDDKAPTKKDMAVSHPSENHKANMHIIQKIAKREYSADINTIAPR